MDKRENIIQELLRFKENISTKINIERMVLFGSRTKNNAHEDSDIDLIVVSKSFKNKDFLERPIILYKKWDLKYPVDFICYTPKEFRLKSKQISIVKEALKKGIEIA